MSILADISNNWLLLSIVAALFWAVVNLLDKMLVIEHIKSESARLILDSFVGLTSCILIYSVGFLSNSTAQVVILSMLAGLILYGFNYLYYKALETADVSVAAVLMQTVPLFTAIWGFLFFNERFTAPVYLGVMLVILGAILSNVEVDNLGVHKLVGGKNWNAAVGYMIPGVFLISLNYALQKYILNFSDSWTVFFWGRIGALILTLAVLAYSKTIRVDFFNTIKFLKAGPVIMLSGVEWLNLCAIFFIILAYSLGPITLVATASAVQPLFVIIIVIFFSIAKRRSVLSDFSGSKRVLATRVFASILLIAGIYLISR